MKNFEQFHEVIKERITNPSAFYYPDPWWENEIKQITLDLDASIEFINEDCTDEEIWWLGEIFDDLMDITRSKELLDCLRKRSERVTNEVWKNDLDGCIADAAEYIDD